MALLVRALEKARKIRELDQWALIGGGRDGQCGVAEAYQKCELAKHRRSSLMERLQCNSE